jgi:hypothetical protein
MTDRGALFLSLFLLTSTSLLLAQGPRFSDLPKDLALVRSQGSGKRMFAVFEDPFCPACKYLEAQLDSISDYTAYRYTYPILGRRSVETSTAVWCSADTLSLWKKTVTTRTALPGNRECLDTIGRILETGERSGIDSTPTLIFENNKARAAVPAEHLARLLAQASRAPASENASKQSAKDTKSSVPPPIQGPKLIEIPSGGEDYTPRPKTPAIFVFTSGDRIESDDYLLTKDSLFITTAGQKRRYPINTLDKTATKTANIERGIVITFPKSNSEFNLNF